MFAPEPLEKEVMHFFQYWSHRLWFWPNNDLIHEWQILGQLCSTGVLVERDSYLSCNHSLTMIQSNPQPNCHPGTAVCRSYTPPYTHEIVFYLWLDMSRQNGDNRVKPHQVKLRPCKQQRVLIKTQCAQTFLVSATSETSYSSTNIKAFRDRRKITLY